MLKAKKYCFEMVYTKNFTSLDGNALTRIHFAFYSTIQI